MGRAKRAGWASTAAECERTGTRRATAAVGDLELLGLVALVGLAQLLGLGLGVAVEGAPPATGDDATGDGLALGDIGGMSSS